jgi:hypothetical protein
MALLLKQPVFPKPGVLFSHACLYDLSLFERPFPILGKSILCTA